MVLPLLFWRDVPLPRRTTCRSSASFVVLQWPGFLRKSWELDRRMQFQWHWRESVRSTDIAMSCAILTTRVDPPFLCCLSLWSPAPLSFQSSAWFHPSIHPSTPGYSVLSAILLLFLLLSSWSDQVFFLPVGMTVDDIDIFEINEAFASQAVYCVEKLGIPMEKVNPKGGAIALGHPLGCTGSRQVATLLHEMKRRGKRYYSVALFDVLEH